MLFNLPSFADKPLILTFAQIGINPAEYNGWTFDKIRPDYINRAADYILDMTDGIFYFEFGYDYEVFAHYEWEIDYLAQLIKIPRSALI
jgi:hypothetical protein